MFCHAKRNSTGVVQQTGAARDPLTARFDTAPRAAVSGPIQRQHNRTGLPDDLKAGMEAQSGLSLDRVRVRYNSGQPARFGAAAATRGLAIDVAPGQERHIPHELGHVVQQMRGRVRATMQLHGIPLNDDPALEAEADRLGSLALRRGVAVHAAGTDPHPGPVMPAQPSQALSPAAPLQLMPRNVPKAKKPKVRRQEAALAAATRRISPSRAAKKLDVNYRSQRRSGGFGLSRDKNLIYPRNPAELISRNAKLGKELFAPRRRKAMTGIHTEAILKNARDAMRTGAKAYTRQERNALRGTFGLDMRTIVKRLSLSKIKSSRNHKLADSATYSIFTNMVKRAGATWGKGQVKAVARLVRALHGNDDDDTALAIQKRMKNAFRASKPAERAAEINHATFLASHGVNNLRLGDSAINLRVLNAYDPNFTTIPEFEDANGNDLDQDAVNTLLTQWQAITPNVNERQKPAFRRRGTARSEEIRAAVLELARKGLIASSLAEASVTGVYDRATGEQISSSSAVS